MMRPPRPVCGPSFVGWISNHGQFPDVFAEAGNGFVRAPFCFVAARGRNKTAIADVRRDIFRVKGPETDKEPARLAGPGRAR
ncbi:protein of unknown function [Bradyrhizobium vignae]|uniref:Uncharacterized protein n=1 Tax=Bradyrhizobium vignae TaxID=1549949 RepID=A0A2U3Q1S1_9BRAD|nr:protein of unknown function [Bradyrhizobium vignae]